MKTIIQFIDCNPTPDVQSHLKEKLEKFESHYSWIISGKVCFKRNKNDKKKNKLIEILLNTPADTIYAEGTAENFHLACDEALQAAWQQLEKHKAKFSPQHIAPTIE